MSAILLKINGQTGEAIFPAMLRWKYQECVGRASLFPSLFCRCGEMQWTVHSNDVQVAFETGDSPRVIKITSLKLSISECWSINRCRKLIATS